jgi:hypothetical protein
VGIWPISGWVHIPTRLVRLKRIQRECRSVRPYGTNRGRERKYNFKEVMLQQRQCCDEIKAGLYSVDVQILPDDNLSVVRPSDLCQVLLVRNLVVRRPNPTVIND